MANYTQPGYDPSLHGYWKGTADGAPNFGYPANYYYADTMRSLFIGFENFFKDLYVIRYNKFGEPVKTIQVPIKFGPRNKSHDFRTEQESGNKYYISLPNLAYRLDSMQFASERAKGIYETRAFYNKDLENVGLICDQQEKFWSDVQPVPYNINVSMEANCEKMTDAEQIVEQIAVRFQPACFFDVKEFWFFNKRRSIKLKMESLNWEIQSESMGEEDWRRIKVTFSFIMEAFLYKPIKDAQIIEKINTYLTLNKGDYIYHAVAFGNKDGSLDNPHDFSKIYQTKVGPVYVLNGTPETTTEYDKEGNPIKYTTVYNYRQTDDLTTYDKDAELLSKVTTTLEKDGEGYKWVTEKEYTSLSGYGNNDDQTIEFGNKTLIDQYGNPYTAHYSTYNEEGIYTSNSADYKTGEYDYLYKTEKVGTKLKTDFEGGKYF
ncbi:MAG: tail sheath stabilizer and completion protein [Methanobrevibacter sp.]|nr:tail sheath stabilizer and completion protein [Methanobrevibacter sp.]